MKQRSMMKAVLEKVQADEIRTKLRRGTGASKGKQKGKRGLQRWKAVVMAT